MIKVKIIIYTVTYLWCAVSGRDVERMVVVTEDYGRWRRMAWGYHVEAEEESYHRPGTVTSRGADVRETGEVCGNLTHLIYVCPSYKQWNLKWADTRENNGVSTHN